MTTKNDMPIRRRIDGSIDTDFYARCAARLRRAARKGQLRRWIRALRSLTAKLNLTVRRRRLSQALAGQGNAMHAG
jgi:hypothetical protein